MTPLPPFLILDVMLVLTGSYDVWLPIYPMSVIILYLIVRIIRRSQLFLLLLLERRRGVCYGTLVVKET